MSHYLNAIYKVVTHHNIKAKKNPATDKFGFLKDSNLLAPVWLGELNALAYIWLVMEGNNDNFDVLISNLSWDSPLLRRLRLYETLDKAYDSRSLMGAGYMPGNAEYRSSSNSSSILVPKKGTVLDKITDKARAQYQESVYQTVAGFYCSSSEQYQDMMLLAASLCSQSGMYIIKYQLSKRAALAEPLKTHCIAIKSDSGKLTIFDWLSGTFYIANEVAQLHGGAVLLEMQHLWGLMGKVDIFCNKLVISSTASDKFIKQLLDEHTEAGGSALSSRSATSLIDGSDNENLSDDGDII